MLHGFLEVASIFSHFLYSQGSCILPGNTLEEVEFHDGVLEKLMILEDYIFPAL